MASFQVYRDPSCPTMTSPLDVRNDHLGGCRNVDRPPSFQPASYHHNVHSDRAHTEKMARHSSALSDISNTTLLVKKTKAAAHAKRDLLKKHVRGRHVLPAIEEVDSIQRNYSVAITKPKHIIDIDAPYRNDQYYAGQYIDDILEHLADLETRNRPSPSYMLKQRELTVELRAVLVDWLIEVSEDCQLVGETLFLMVNYIDRFMSKKNVMKHQLQLLGLAAIFVA
eukprot:Partr_v1_DN28630_c2_g1_i1_m50068 putative g2 mitotic-specific